MEEHHGAIEKSPLSESMTTDEDGDPLLARGEFDIEKATEYFVCQSGIICCAAACIGFLAPMLYCSTKRSIAAQRLTLTDKSVKYHTETYCCIPPFCFDPCLLQCNTQNKTVPLEKITDITFSQGILQRWFGVEAIAVQTASGGGEAGPDMGIIGLKDAKEFKRVVMQAKNAQQSGEGSAAAAIRAFAAHSQSAPPQYGADQSYAALQQIASGVQHIEQLVARIEGHVTKYEKLKKSETSD